MRDVIVTCRLCKNETSNQKPYCIEHLDHCSSYLYNLIHNRPSDLQATKSDILEIVARERAIGPEKLQDMLGVSVDLMQRAIRALLRKKDLTESVIKMGYGHPYRMYSIGA